MSGISLITKTQAANPAAATGTTSQTASSGQTLTQNDFLKLLVAQMQYQDPMNPQSDTQMAAQMAQFTSLQQTTQMSSSLSMLQANNLVGSTVTVQTDPNNPSSLTTGVVTGVTMTSGSPQIQVTDPKTLQKTSYNLSQVVSMTPTTLPASTSTTTPAANSSTGN